MESPVFWFGPNSAPDVWSLVFPLVLCREVCPFLIPQTLPLTTVPSQMFSGPTHPAHKLLSAHPGPPPLVARTFPTARIIPWNSPSSPCMVRVWLHPILGVVTVTCHHHTEQQLLFLCTTFEEVSSFSGFLLHCPSHSHMSYRTSLVDWLGNTGFFLCQFPLL